MARQFGIITTTSGIASIVVTSFSTSHSAEIAEARDEEGKVTDLKAYSRGVSVSVRGYLDASEVSIDAGDVLSLNGKDYLVESVNVSETNTNFVEVDFTARTADNALIDPYTKKDTE